MTKEVKVKYSLSTSRNHVLEETEVINVREDISQPDLEDLIKDCFTEWVFENIEASFEIEE